MIETLVHVYDMMSVWEMLPFLIMAIGSTLIYIKSGMNLAAAYLYQRDTRRVIYHHGIQNVNYVKLIQE